MIDWISAAVPGHERFEVYLDGKKMLDIVEAKASKEGNPGFVIQVIYDLDGKPVMDQEKGTCKTRILVGRVVLRELPKDVIPRAMPQL